jgi:hypothetical protein
MAEVKSDSIFKERDVGQEAVFGDDTSKAYGENLAMNYGSVVKFGDNNTVLIVIIIVLSLCICMSISIGGLFYYTQTKKIETM